LIIDRAPGIGKTEYDLLQCDIAEVADSVNHPAIVLDSLWYVGNRYCRYRPLLCDKCWFGKEYCSNHSKFVWGSTSGKTTEERKKERQEEKEILDEISEVRQSWWLNNPEKPLSDFFDSDEFKEWYNSKEE